MATKARIRQDRENLAAEIDRLCSTRCRHEHGGCKNNSQMGPGRKHAFPNAGLLCSRVKLAEQRKPRRERRWIDPPASRLVQAAPPLPFKRDSLFLASWPPN